MAEQQSLGVAIDERQRVNVLGPKSTPGLDGRIALTNENERHPDDHGYGRESHAGEGDGSPSAPGFLWAPIIDLPNR